MNKGQQTIVSQPVSEIVFSTFLSADIILTISIKQMEVISLSSQTEKIYQIKISISLKSISLFPEFISDPFLSKIVSLIEMIIEAVDIIISSVNIYIQFSGKSI